MFCKNVKVLYADGTLIFNISETDDECQINSKFNLNNSVFTPNGFNANVGFSVKTKNKNWFLHTK